jgi:hypothetical protein
MRETYKAPSLPPPTSQLSASTRQRRGGERKSARRDSSLVFPTSQHLARGLRHLTGYWSSLLPPGLAEFVRPVTHTKESRRADGCGSEHKKGANISRRARTPGTFAQPLCGSKKRPQPRPQPGTKRRQDGKTTSVKIPISMKI